MTTEFKTIRKFNARGMAAFEMYFVANTEDRNGEISKFRSYAPPIEILFDEQYTEELEGCGTVPTEVPTDKYVMAKTVCGALSGKMDEYRLDEAVWAWLTLLWSDKILPATEIGDKTVWKLKEQSAYVLNRESARRFRHRVWGPAVLYADYGDLSRTLQGGDFDVMTDVVDTLSWSNVFTPEVMKAMDLAYFDVGSNKLLDGATATRKKRGEEGARKGGIPDFIDLILQIGRTHSIDRMSAMDLINKLPSVEFGVFQLNAAKRIKAKQFAPELPAFATEQVALV